MIYLINLIGSLFSFHIGLNYITAILAGILGIPGVILLVILKIFLGWYLHKVWQEKTNDIYYFSSGNSNYVCVAKNK